MVHACNPSAQEGEAGRTLVKSHLWLQDEFKTSLSCTGASLKIKCAAIFRKLNNHVLNQ